MAEINNLEEQEYRKYFFDVKQILGICNKRSGRRNAQINAQSDAQINAQSDAQIFFRNGLFFFYNFELYGIVWEVAMREKESGNASYGGGRTNCANCGGLMG